MAHSLILIYKLNLNNNDFIHVQQKFSEMGIRATSLDYIQLARWGFIEPKSSDRDPQADDAGFWRITNTGKYFVQGITTAPRDVYVYNNHTEKWGIELTDIHKALGTKFDYQQLLNS